MSFSDLMSSGRGPGVIGMVMALVVVIGFGLLFMFAFDEGMQGADQSIESIISQQAREIESYQSAITEGSKKLAASPGRVAASRELSALKRLNQSATEKIATLGQSVATGRSEVEAQNQRLEEYKDQYRTFIRGTARGQSLATLETRTGVTYKNVIIREVSPVGIQIQHDEGHKRIPFEELPDAMVDLYQFDPAQKSQALVVEAATRTEHEAQAAAANELADQAMVEQRAKDEVARRQKVVREIAVKQAAMDSLRDEIRGLEREQNRAAAAASAARAAGRMHINKSSSIGGTIRSKQNRLSVLASEIAQLKASIQR
jgi:chromosome segregation ATPase